MAGRTALALLLTLGATAASAQTSAEDQARVRENFRTADQNGDGKLDRQEFKTLIDLNAKLGLGQAAQVQRFGAYGLAFDRGDQNKDGYVEPAELTAIRNR